MWADVPMAKFVEQSALLHVVKTVYLELKAFRIEHIPRIGHNNETYLKNTIWLFLFLLFLYHTIRVLFESIALSPLAELKGNEFFIETNTIYFTITTALSIFYLIMWCTSIFLSVSGLYVPFGPMQFFGVIIEILVDFLVSIALFLGSYFLFKILSRMINTIVNNIYLIIYYFYTFIGKIFILILKSLRLNSEEYREVYHENKDKLYKKHENYEWKIEFE